MALGAQVAALGPSHGAHEPDSEVGQIRALLAGDELHVGARPLGGPEVFIVGPVERRAAGPVVPRQLQGIFDSEVALFGAVYQEESAERPKGLTAEVLLVLLIDHRDLLTPAGEFVSGDQPGQTCTDDDDISVHPTAFLELCVGMLYAHASDTLMHRMR